MMILAQGTLGVRGRIFFVDSLCNIETVNQIMTDY